MSAANYVFDAAQAGSELERLRALETIFDPATRQLLEHVGLASGWHCLEVGAGAGSIARWIGEIVGDRGRAVALDTDPKFLGDGASTGLEVRQADISTAPPERACFDLAHARYVLIHVAARERALQNLLDALRPGGWLVLEEPDFSAARSVPAEDKQASAFAAINRAIERMFAGLNLDRATGLQLPALLQRNGLRSMAVETDAPPRCRQLGGCPANENVGSQPAGPVPGHRRSHRGGVGTVPSPACRSPGLGRSLRHGQSRGSKGMSSGSTIAREKAF